MNDHVPETITLPMKADALVPHRPPMLLVDSIVEREGDRALVTAVMPRDGICFELGVGFPEFYIEVIAQAIAVANGYDGISTGEKVQNGMLVGVDSFVFHENGAPGDILSVEVEKTFEFEAVKLICGKVMHEDTLLAEAEIKVWVDLGLDGGMVSD